jgi:O-methyltransferase domain
MLHLRAWPEVVHSVKTGETAFSRVFGRELFPYVTTNAEAGQVFDDAMASYTAATSNAVVAAYDFSRFENIVDVGGGNGALIAAILQRTPRATGVNFDLPPTAERAKANLGARGLAGRCEVVGGDFFESVQCRGDVLARRRGRHGCRGGHLDGIRHNASAATDA